MLLLALAACDAPCPSTTAELDCLSAQLTPRVGYDPTTLRVESRADGWVLTVPGGVGCRLPQPLPY
jgi:hypothetical protein